LNALPTFRSEIIGMPLSINRAPTPMR